MRKGLFFLLSLAVMGAASAQGVLNTEPPLGFSAQNGIVVHNEGRARSMGYTPADLLFLVPDIDAIPGYTVVVPDDQTTSSSSIPLGHTSVDLNAGGGIPTEGDVLHSRVYRIWFPIERAQAYASHQIATYSQLRARGSISVSVTVRTGTPSIKYMQDTGVVSRGTPSTKPLGDEAMYYNIGGVAGIVFRYDKSVVNVSAPDLNLAEAIAQSVLYRLLVHPRQVFAPMPVPNLLLEGKSFSSPQAASLNGVVVVPVSALEPYGVSVVQNRTSNLWTATLQKGTRTVQVQAYSWEAGTGSGKVKLERAVFPFGDQLVVPLQQIAEALGMEVQAQ